MNDERSTERSPVGKPGLFKWPWPDIAMRIMVWGSLGITINFFPPIIAYVIGVGDSTSGGHSSLIDALSSGDLLIATTAILPPTLADLAISVQRARRARTIIVILGALVCLVSLMVYCFAFANYLSLINHQPVVAKNLSPDLVVKLSIVFFAGAIVLGSICTGFLAAGDEQSSDERPKSGG